MEIISAICNIMTVLFVLFFLSRILLLPKFVLSASMEGFFCKNFSNSLIIINDLIVPLSGMA